MLISMNVSDVFMYICILHVISGAEPTKIKSDV